MTTYFEAPDGHGESDERLNQRAKEIRARLAATTPGVWKKYNANEGMDHAYGPMWCVANDAFHNPPDTDDEPWLAVEIHTGVEQDADFIAHSREDIGFLLALIDRQVPGQSPDSAIVWAEVDE